MPSLNDYSKEDDDTGGASDGYTPAQSSAIGASNSATAGGSAPGGAAVGSATGAPKQAQASKQEEDSYVPWSSFVSANQDVSNREAGKLAGQVQGDVNTAQGDLTKAQQGFNSSVDADYGKDDSQSSNSSPPAATQTASKAPRAAPSDTSSAPAASSANSDPWSSLSGFSSSTTPLSSAATSGGGLGRVPFNAVSANATGPITKTPATAQPVQSAPTIDANAAPTANPASAPTVDASAPSIGASAAPNVTVKPAGVDALRNPGPPTPWGSLAGPSGQTVAAQKLQPSSLQQTPAASALQGFARSKQLGANVIANGPQGPNDLESAAGQKAWASLLGDTEKAKQEAQALGSETGVQGLLQSQASMPTNSAFDAALVNGAGGQQFQQLAKQYGGDQLGQNVINAEQASQDQWKQLTGDVNTARQFQQAQANAPAWSSLSGTAASGTAAPSAQSDAAAATPTNTGPTDAQQQQLDAARAQSGPGIQSAMDQLASGDQGLDGFIAALNGWGFNDVAPGNQTAAEKANAQQLQQKLQGYVNIATNGLGISQQDLMADMGKMNAAEYQNFWALGVIPGWMKVNGGYGANVVGGWQSPFVQNTLSYGTDGGTWNAVTNMWKNGLGQLATSAAGGPAGIIGGGVKDATNTTGKGLSN